MCCCCFFFVVVVGPIKTSFLSWLSNDCQIGCPAFLPGPLNRTPFRKNPLSLVFSVGTINKRSGLLSVRNSKYGKKTQLIRGIWWKNYLISFNLKCQLNLSLFCWVLLLVFLSTSIVTLGCTSKCETRILPIHKHKTPRFLTKYSLTTEEEQKRLTDLLRIKKGTYCFHDVIINLYH